MTGRMTRWIASFLLTLVLAPIAAAQIVYIDRHHPHPIPEPRPIGPPTERLILESYHAEVKIQDGIAKTVLKQVFRNPLRTVAEGQYLYPLPPGAAVQDFTMMMNGKEVKGEVIDKDKARQIYEGIVRRQRDPGLLEYLGYGLLRASLFPVPASGTVEVSLTYSEILEKEGGALFTFVQPTGACRTAGQAPKVSVAVDIATQVPLKMVFSPTAGAEVVKKDDHHAKASFEGGATDFRLYYSLAQAEFGVTVLSYREPGTREGFFILNLAPQLSAPSAKRQPKDVAFVVDTSGSMSGEKIQQAKEALKYCLQSLSEGDRFNLVPFSLEARPFSERLVEVDAQSIERAVGFVDRIEAAGGTNIRDALIAALDSHDQKSDRVFQILFITDGLPTIGETDVKKILSDFRVANGSQVRLFPFGVGDDVNTFLIDKLAQENRGSREYVRPGEDLEVKISGLFTKISEPALVDPKVRVDGVELYEYFPSQLPDIFRGSDLVVIGKYRGEGHHAIHLSGGQGGEEKSWVYEASFASSDLKHDYLPRLWATRKVGYLLDQIRLHGSNQEMIDDVIRIAKQYGIVTPYTSNLIVEENELAALGSGPARDAANGYFFGRGTRARAEGESAEALHRLGHVQDSVRPAGPGSPGASGAAAVRLSLESKKLSEAKAPDSALPLEKLGDRTILENVREVDGRIFYRVGDVWVDGRWAEKDEEARKAFTLKKIEAFSDEYFALLKKQPELKKFFALGQRIVVCSGQTTYEVVTP
ncbi:MAG: VIT domain-containing protein [Planctomycetota bacterium]